MPRPRNRTGVGADVTGKNLECRGLTGTVRSEEAQDLTFPDGERDVVHGDSGAIPLGDVLNFDHTHLSGPRHQRRGRNSKYLPS